MKIHKHNNNQKTYNSNKIINRFKTLNKQYNKRDRI